MAKIRYLSGKGSEQKLRRNVPKELRSVTGRTAWTERVPNLTGKQLRIRANAFAVRTDAEIAALQATLRSYAKSGTNEIAALIDIATARSLAAMYQHERRAQLATDGSLDFDHPTFSKAELLSEAISDLDEARHRLSIRERGEPHVIAYLQEKGMLADTLSVDQRDALLGSEGFRALADLIARVDFENARTRVDYLTEDGSLLTSDLIAEKTGVPDYRPATRPSTSGKTLAEVAEFYLSQKRELSSSRRSQFNLPIRALYEEFGEQTPIVQITRDGLRDLASFLPSVPANPAKFYGDIPLREAASKFESSHGQTAGRYSEAGKHLAVINSLLQMAVDEGWLASNPAKGIQVAQPKKKMHEAAGETYRPLKIDELNRLFSLPYFHGCQDDEHGRFRAGPNLPTRHAYWAPIISLWSGLRMNEILQLEKADIRHSENGTAYFDITDEIRGHYADGQFKKAVKTKQAIRRVPVHPQLVEFGLLRWVELQKADRLFPEALPGPDGKYSGPYSKRFKTTLEKAGIWEPRRAVFHSLRNNFNDALRNAGVPLELREAINGWISGNSMDRKYGAGFTIERLADEVRKVDYPGLEIEHLIANEQKI